MPDERQGADPRCDRCGYTSAGVMVGFKCPFMSCGGRITTDSKVRRTKPYSLAEVPVGSEVTYGASWLGKVIATGGDTARWGGGLDDVAVRSHDEQDVSCWRYWQVEVLSR